MSSEKIYPVYIEWRAMVGAVAHAMHGLPHEVIGFLVGRPFVWNGTTYVYIKAALMGKANALRHMSSLRLIVWPMLCKH